MHQIRYFLAVSETLNFTRAAERCNVTQPSLTRAIQALEAEFGGELLRRERSLSHLTELGARMLPLMRQCYESAAAAKALAQSVKQGATASLSVALSRAINLALFLPTLHELSRAFPGLRLNLRRGSAAEVAGLLKAGEVELAVAGPLGEIWERLDTYPIFVEPFELFVSREHGLAGRNAAELDDLQGERFLLHDDCEMPEELARRLDAAGLPLSTAHQAATVTDLIALLEANLGVAILPISAVRSERLCRVPLKGLDLTHTVAVYSVAGRRRALAGAALFNLLRAAQWPAFEADGQRRGVA